MEHISYLRHFTRSIQHHFYRYFAPYGA